jgi:pilus assembly protein FimV
MGLALCGNALALSLGRISLQSARGEPLQAEIELSALSPEEAASLRARIASAEAFGRAGVDYSPALAGARISVQQRADGMPVLRIRSDQPVQESFLDLILEVDWSSGRLTREYTLLFEVARPAAESTPAEAAALLGAAPPPPPPSLPRAQGAGAAVATPPSTPGTDADRYVVRRGDTLSGVAGRIQGQGASLEQLLVALYRGNPQAFIGQNMNRLRADAVLRVPSAEQAKQMARTEAREVVRVQSADFNAYRQRLAQSVPAARVDESARRSGGAVEAAVEDRRKAPATPDRLKLSRTQPGASPEAKLSHEAEQRDQSQRVAELSRNVDDLRRLTTNTPAAPRPTTPPTPAAPVPSSPPTAVQPTVPTLPTPPAVSAAASAPVVSAAASTVPAESNVVSAPASATEAVVAAASAASAPAPAPLPEMAASAAEAASAVASSPVLVPPEAKPASPGFLARSWPLLAGGTAAVLALLGGVLLWRHRRKGGNETSFLESRLQPESFFKSGEQSPDSREAGALGSASASASDSYSLSQLDAIGDVDPVAEADVYLAYGRDLQAEEILKEAMRSNPQRLAIRTKLLEVYAKRHDEKAFEQLAQQLHQITQGQGEDWAKARELGQQIDPDNPLYAGGEAVPSRMPASVVPSGWMVSQPPALGAGAAAGSAAENLDLDLNLLDDAPAKAPDSKLPVMGGGEPAVLPGLTSDFPQPGEAGAGTPASVSPGESLFALEPRSSTMAPEQEEGLPELDFGMSEMPVDAEPGAQPTEGPPSLPFDLDSLSLDLEQPSTAAVLDELHISGFGEASDPLERKLELADEFRRIGDTDGARDLLKEVVAQASGPMKERAQGMLDSLV